MYNKKVSVQSTEVYGIGYQVELAVEEAIELHTKYSTNMLL